MLVYDSYLLLIHTYIHIVMSTKQLKSIHDEVKKINNYSITFRD